MITSTQTKKIYSEICLALSRMGENNPREFERQTLYGDVLDWIKMHHPELRNDDYDDDFVAKYVVGQYLLKN